MKKYLLILFSISFIHAVAQDNLDIIIQGGKIIDGSGNPWFYGDVGIRNGKIVKIGDLKNETAKRFIPAKGLIVSPGFIDVHTHIEGNEREVPTADNFIYDGVTSVVTGNCGSSNTDIAKYFYSLDSIKMSINVATLVGHNSVRRKVMGEGNHVPTPEEQKQMEQLVAQAMQQGAVGFSTGLIYVPGTYSKTEEVIGLAKAASQFGGVYASHIRDEGDHVLDAIEEAVNIGRQANMPVEISHFKVTYKPNWGRSIQTLDKVIKAREEGIDVTIDQYPYVASSTTLNTLVPSWALSGGRDSLKARLSNTLTRKKIKEKMAAELNHKQLNDYSYALVARFAADTTFNGKTLTEINKIKGRKTKPLEEAETILEMVEEGSAQMIYFSMNEEDLRRFMKYPFNMAASDAGINKFGSGMPHPRGYGTNARVLATYVRDAKLITLEEAVRRMSSLPALHFNIQDRGLLREGMAADILVFDEKKVQDKSTFQKPHAYSEGFQYVLVNGELVIENARHTGKRSGQILKGPGFGK